MPSGAITIHGGTGADTISFAFTVSGTHTLQYAQNLANTVDHLLAPTTTGGDGQSITYIDQGAFGSARAADPTPVYVLVPETSAPTAPFIVGTSGYVIDTVGGSATVDGASTGGDSVIVAAVNAGTTFNAEGTANQVIFVDGNNTYNAALDTTTGTYYDLGNDTIVAGSGFDTIRTGSGATTVNSGTGDATIYLNDTGSSAFNDHVWLDDGKSTIYANGTGDGIVATTEGQTIIGGTSATSQLAVVLLPNSDQSVNGNDLVTAGAGTTTVYDASAANTVIAGSGNLYFLGAAGTTADPTTASLTTGAGNVYAFDESNTSLTVGGAGTGTFYFVAGSGNETLDGAGSSSTMYIVGGDSTSTDSLVGGSGHNVITAGAGSETLTGGTGTNIYQIADGSSANATLSITDFGSGSNNNLILDGFTQQDINNLLSGTGTESGGNFTVALSNGASVTFDGYASGSALSSALTGHIVTFNNS